MFHTTPQEALGVGATDVHEAVVETVQSVHNRFAEAQHITRSRYGDVYGNQWRVLLDEVHDALSWKGYRTHTLRPGSYKVPVVGDCLVYTWRMPAAAGESVARFASSPTRKSGFDAAAPHPLLFETDPGGEPDGDDAEPQVPAVEQVISQVPERLSVVLVVVHSTPRRLQKIEWGLAELSEQTGEIELHGRQTIWEFEMSSDGEGIAPEGAFDSGEPVGPTLTPRKQEGQQPDA